MPVLSNTIFLVMVGIVGLLVGLLLGYLFSDREPKKAREDGIPADLRKDGFSDVARLLYSPSKKRIITGMDGGFFHEAKELTPDQRTRLAKVIRIWGDWTNRPNEQAEEMPAQPEAAPVATAVEAVSSAAPAPVSTNHEPEAAPQEPAPVPFDASALHTPEEESSSNPLQQEPVRPVVDLVNDETPAEPVPAEAPQPVAEAEKAEIKNQTIVEQINDVLQGKLAGTVYEQRGLALKDDLNNGVIVFIGSEKYSAIEEVPYDDAQEMIRDAVAEWQQKFEASQSAGA